MTQGNTLVIDDDLLCAARLPASERSESSASCEQPAATPTLAELQKSHIEQTLELTDWVVEGPQGAARILDIHPNTLRGHMRRLGIKRPAHLV